MNRSQSILVALAPANGESYSPVQVQKLLFLLEKVKPKIIDSKEHFNFQPYHYGPFDASIYTELNKLRDEGLVDIFYEDRLQNYSLTPKGQELGNRLLEKQPQKTKKYIKELSVFIRSLTFTELVSAVYKAYPEMKVNSIFQGC